ATRPTSKPGRRPTRTRGPGSGCDRFGCDRLKPLHALGALWIVVMWGLNFTVIRFGLDEFPPFTFAAWRFALGALPVPFVPEPNLSWGMLAGIGCFMFGGQF